MLTISESAGSKIKEMMSAEAEAKYLRVGVQAGGCSGFSYGMGFDVEKREGDAEITLHGIPVIVDAESQKYLKGTVIDYKESLMGGGFTIHNPNAIATCGCGSSFRTKEEEGNPEKCDD